MIYISGTKEEAKTMGIFLNDLPSHVVNMTGKLSLSEFISFISSCDGVVACSTGPLHIAASLGKTAVGLYPPNASASSRQVEADRTGYKSFLFRKNLF
jgi:heptosyltransferase III